MNIPAICGAFLFLDRKLFNQQIVQSQIFPPALPPGSLLIKTGAGGLNYAFAL